MLNEIQNKIDAGTFDYRKYFPKSPALEGMGLSVINNSMTFGVYAPAWLEQQQLEYSTLKTYKSALHSKLLTFFGSMAMSEILPFHIRQFVKTLENYSPKYVRNIIGALSVIFASAIDDGLITRNPCEFIKTPKNTTKQIDALTLEEAGLIIKYADEHYPKMSLFFAIGFYMGLRTGEIMGLQWGDFDFKSNTLTVQRTITNNKIKNSTKTAEKRTIDIPPILDKYILRHKQYTFLKSDWVFISYQGAPYKNYNSITDFYWKPALQFNGIRYRQMYQMRHSFASNSLASGFAPAWVQKMLGHSTLAMIIKIYGNYIYKSEGRQGFGSGIISEKQGQNKGNA